MPFYYLQPVQLSLGSESVTFAKYFPLIIILLLALFSLIYRPFKKFETVRSPLDRYVILYFCVGAISIMDAAYVEVGLLKIVYYTLTGTGLLYLLLFQAFPQQRIYLLIKWVFFVATLVAFYGVTVYILQRDYIWGFVYDAHNPYYSGISRSASTLGNAVFTGSYLALCLPFSLWAWHCESNPKLKRIYLGCFLITLIGLGSTFTRGAWLAASLALIIYCWPQRDSLLMYFRRCVNFRGIVIIGIVILFSISALENAGFRGGIHQTWRLFWMRLGHATVISETESFRLAQYKTTWRVLQVQPFWGIGFGNFTRLFDQYKHPSTPPGYIAKTTENMYLMVTCETGLVGLCSFLGLLFFAIREVWVAYDRAPVGPDRSFLLALLASFCGFMVNMITWDALNQQTVRMTFWMLVGFALCQIRLIEEKKKSGES